MKELSLFDTHAHYDHIRFDGLGPELAEELFAYGVLNGAVIPAISYESNFNRDLFPAERFPTVFFAAGLHPRYAVNEAWWSREKRAEFDRLLDDRRTVAVKTGLDHCVKKLTDSQKEHQERFFRYPTDRANERGLPLVFHVREAGERFVELLERQPLRVEAVVHCCTFGPELTERMLSVGVTRFGIGGMLTLQDMEPLRESVRRLPLSAILLETDAPFVKPQGYGGRVNTSATLLGTLRLVAELKGLSSEAAAQAVERNAREFYRLQ